MTRKITELMNRQVLSGMEKEISREILAEIIGSFIREVGEHLNALGESGNRQEQATIIAGAHAIKSSAAPFGASFLQEVAGQVEVLGREGKVTEAISALDTLEDVAQQTMQLYTCEYIDAAGADPLGYETGGKSNWTKS